MSLRIRAPTLRQTMATAHWSVVLSLDDLDGKEFSLENGTEDKCFFEVDVGQPTYVN